MGRESWLNGNRRERDRVYVGVNIHCAGCGKDMGKITGVHGEPKIPDWPFYSRDCPVCELRDKEG